MDWHHPSRACLSVHSGKVSGILLAVVCRVVNRALSMSVLAIDQMTARLARRAQLPEKVGRTWTDEEEQLLRDEFSGGEPIPLIATKHGRTIQAIEARLEKLGLLTMERRTTTSAFSSETKRDDK